MEPNIDEYIFWLQMSERGNIRNYNEIMVRVALMGRLDIIKKMIELGANDYLNTAEKAALNGHIEIVKFMLDKIANDTRENYDYERWAAKNEVMYAASYGGYIEIVKLMLDRGAKGYEQAIQMAAMAGHTEIVKLIESARD